MVTPAEALSQYACHPSAPSPPRPRGQRANPFRGAPHEQPRHPLDFSGRTVLVVGGSSGIGNGIARAFLAQGAEVHVWGTRASASDYQAEEGSDLTGLHFTQVDVGDGAAISAQQPAFQQLDVLVLSQGIVLY